MSTDYLITSEVLIDRSHFFLPSILIMTIIVIAYWFFYKSNHKRIMEDLKAMKQVRDKESVAAFFKGNWWRMLLMIFAAVLFSPVKNELLFRMPLLVAFGSFSEMTWNAIYVSAVLYALFQSLSFKTNFLKEDMWSKYVGAQRTFLKIGAYVLNFLSWWAVGIAAGYVAIRYQSLFVCVLFGITLPFICAALTLIYQLVLMAIVEITTPSCREIAKVFTSRRRTH